MPGNVQSESQLIGLGSNKRRPQGCNADLALLHGGYVAARVG